jgi:hypothetical protein
MVDLIKTIQNYVYPFPQQIKYIKSVKSAVLDRKYEWNLKARLLLLQPVVHLKTSD